MLHMVERTILFVSEDEEKAVQKPIECTGFFQGRSSWPTSAWNMSHFGFRDLRGH